jgi:hypothetical protein
MISSGGELARACAMRLRHAAEIGLPLTAALTVAGLIRAALARSVALHPRRAISWRRSPECTVTLTTVAPTPCQVESREAVLPPILGSFSDRIPDSSLSGSVGR